MSRWPRPEGQETPAWHSTGTAPSLGQNLESCGADRDGSKSKHWQGLCNPAFRRCSILDHVTVSLTLGGWQDLFYPSDENTNARAQDACQNREP